MTGYPRQIDRQYLSYRSGGFDKIHMIDGGAFDLHQDLVLCDRRRRYIFEHQPPTVFQQSDSFHAISPGVVSASVWWRVAACPVRELRECAAELALQAGDVGAVAYA